MGSWTDGNRTARSHRQMMRHRVSSSSVVRASDCITEGRGFKSYLELGFFSKLMSFQHLNQGISIIIQLQFVEYKLRPKPVQISRDICTPEDRLDRFSRNAQATNWVEVTKIKKFGVLDDKSLIRRFVV